MYLTCVNLIHSWVDWQHAPSGPRPMSSVFYELQVCVSSRCE